MKAIWFFYIGATIDIIALLVALYFIIGDIAKGRSGTNNPIMFLMVFLMMVLIAGAFLLKNAGKVGAANSLLWLPGIPIAGYGLLVLLFIIALLKAAVIIQNFMHIARLWREESH